MATGFFQAPILNGSILDGNGYPLAFGTVVVKLAGTNIAVNAYADPYGASKYPSPIMIGGDGTIQNNSGVSGLIYLSGGNLYDFYVYSASGVTVRVYQAISLINDVSGQTQTQPIVWYPYNNSISYGSSTSFIANDTNATGNNYFEVGRRVSLTLSNVAYTATVTNSVYDGTNTIVTVSFDDSTAVITTYNLQYVLYGNTTVSNTSIAQNYSPCNLLSPNITGGASITGGVNMPSGSFMFPTQDNITDPSSYMGLVNLAQVSGLMSIDMSNAGASIVERTTATYNGYFVLNAQPNDLIIQYIYKANFADPGYLDNQYVYYPIAFPNKIYCVWLSSSIGTNATIEQPVYKPTLGGMYIANPLTGYYIDSWNFNNSDPYNDFCLVAIGS